jgi:hypothetical protein
MRSPLRFPTATTISGQQLVVRTLAGQNTNTKVSEAIAQRVRNDIVASFGAQQETLRILAQPQWW